MSVGWKFQIIQETLKEEDNLLNVLINLLVAFV